jgi:hypothetical protein
MYVLRGYYIRMGQNFKYFKLYNILVQKVVSLQEYKIQGVKGSL